MMLERGRAGPPVKALFIILTVLLVLVNAFFVIAEYSLVRSRRARLQAMADEGKRGAQLALRQLDEHRRLHRRLPGRDHDGLDRHRRARRAGARARVRAAARRPARPHRRGRRLGRDLLPADHGRPEHHRRDRAEALHDPARRGPRAPDRAAAAVLPDGVLPADRGPELGLVLAAADARHRPRRRARGRDARTRSSGSSPSRAPAAASTSARRTC